MALNSIVHHSFLFLDPELHLYFDVRALFPTDTTVNPSKKKRATKGPKGS